MATYKIVRYFQNSTIRPRTIKTGLTLEEAQKWTSDPETSSLTATSKRAKAIKARYGEWFDGFREEAK